MRYPVGKTVDLTATFINKDTGLAFDPDDVYLDVEWPNGVRFAYHYGVLNDPIVRNGMGNYQFRIDLGLVGHWFYKWHCTMVTGAKDAQARVLIEVVP